jgi:hypothetical protein
MSTSESSARAQNNLAPAAVFSTLSAKSPFGLASLIRRPTRASAFSETWAAIFNNNEVEVLTFSREGGPVKLRHFSLQGLLSNSALPFQESEGGPDRVGNHGDLAAKAIEARSGQDAATKGHSLLRYLDRILYTDVVEPVRMTVEASQRH